MFSYVYVLVCSCFIVFMFCQYFMFSYVSVLVCLCFIVFMFCHVCALLCLCIVIFMFVMCTFCYAYVLFLHSFLRDYKQ